MAVIFPHQTRVAALQERLGAEELDALLVADLTNIRYLCGFRGSYGILVVDREHAHFITDGRYAEIAEGMVSGARIHVQPLAKVDDYFQDFFRQRGYGRLGYEGTLTVDQFDNLKRRLRPAKTKARKASGLVADLRRVKDDAEIRVIRRAAKLADRMMETAWAELKPGAREDEVSLAIRRAAEDLGGEGESFTNIVASGTNASRPHHQPAKRRMRSGDMVTVDLGGIVDGYCSDLTRNPCVGSAKKKFEEIYAVCLEAQEAAVKACRCGTECREVDAVARDIIESAGYGEYFVHGTGHGVGLEIHEAPRLNRTSTETLREGDVITVEPGIYLPGFGGVRIEDLIVVTGGAPKVLSRAPKQLTVLPA